MRKAAIVMAGGFGFKFWPRGTEKTPKQFNHLIGEGTLIQNTIQRVRNYFELDDIYVVGNRSFENMIKEQLPEIRPENIILEPLGKNTAPCMALCALKISRKYDKDTVIYTFPSDQVISNAGEFYQSLDTAGRAATETDGIVTIGIEPTRPETQFGYIQIHDDERGELGSLFDAGVRYTTTFAEKPDKGTAARFIESGDFLWNSGIFIWKLGTFNEAFEKYLPDHYYLFSRLSLEMEEAEFERELNNVYKTINRISLDFGILEKAPNVYCVKSSFSWSDLGTWDELYRLSLKDARNNVIVGDVIALNTKNSLISSEGKLIGVVGLEDVIVIDTGEALLVCKRGESEQVKELVDFMRRKNISKY